MLARRAVAAATTRVNDFIPWVVVERVATADETRLLTEWQEIERGLKQVEESRSNGLRIRGG